ncbi:gas vesicle protein GvpG [Janibacter cremeus]|uniref:gas vesicle protein GvpG n=1 Tax=Janibacter cremeus TaxID=1285192 RepID=UPI0023F774D7|nr:gas vesicle protein GvpG [Janibacter cremeus]WEV78835.1 gas vesicle protein GvpG [Janibacter cremeus]
MGLIKEVLLLPAAPLRGTVWVAERVLEKAEEDYYNPGLIRREIEQVDQLRRTGEISDEAAEEWEDALIERLIESRRRPGARGGGH